MYILSSASDCLKIAYQVIYIVNTNTTDCLNKSSPRKYSYLIINFSSHLDEQLSLSVLGEAVAGGHNGDVVGTDDIQVEGPEVSLLSARKL